MNTDQMETEMIERLSQAGLLHVVDRASSHVLSFEGKTWAEVVLNDASKKDEVEDVIRPLLGASGSLLVRSRWNVAQIGDPVPAYGADGGLRAAILIPVLLKSGSAQHTVTVSITKAAEWELERILGGKVPFKSVAEIMVHSSLQLGGQSAWDPISQDYLEVASGGVANLSRLLRQAA
jgi:hypothetical protein